MTEAGRGRETANNRVGRLTPQHLGPFAQNTCRGRGAVRDPDEARSPPARYLSECTCKGTPALGHAIAEALPHRGRAVASASWVRHPNRGLTSGGPPGLLRPHRV